MSDSRRKKKRKVRQKEWETDADRTYTHELKRHRRTDTTIRTVSERRTISEDFEPNGLVVSHTKKYAFVMWEGEETQCRIDEALIESSGSTLLAPGDRVLVELMDDKPFVRAIAPRDTTLSRHSIEGSRLAEQVVAANIDVLVIVCSAVKPRFKPGLVDRYLIAAQLGGVNPIICLNKCDLPGDEPAQIAEYRNLGIQVIKTSALTGEGLDELREVLSGTVSVLAGQSGVGKSTLLNSISPELDIETQEVSDATDKGKHTTTSARMYQLQGDIRIIDTPGIRKLGLVKITEQDLPFYFPELEERAPECRFRNCTHIHEPDCAVLAALEAGEIEERRYKSYLHIRESLEESGAKY